jgi:hypothetical protein
MLNSEKELKKWLTLLGSGTTVINILTYIAFALCLLRIIGYI